MADGTWRHHWQYPIYGEWFDEVIDVYKEEDEDGIKMRDGDGVWSDITRTRFQTTGAETVQSFKDGRAQNSTTH